MFEYITVLQFPKLQYFNLQDLVVSFNNFLRDQNIFLSIPVKQGEEEGAPFETFRTAEHFIMFFVQEDSRLSCVVARNTKATFSEEFNRTMNGPIIHKQHAVAYQSVSKKPELQLAKPVVNEAPPNEGLIIWGHTNFSHSIVVQSPNIVPCQRSKTAGNVLTVFSYTCTQTSSLVSSIDGSPHRPPPPTLLMRISMPRH